ncbi:unnamed protein product [Schistosoma curassoni]|uniref:Uncharacterized protein n=1 Tax=Schistosoma curassoni TaxID=6186 RepID=A0A183JRJ1_9TREM|nr:unnamed protein product [Schistosoma curassoni]
MGRLCRCGTSTPMIGIETSATTKIQCMGLRKPTLRCDPAFCITGLKRLRTLRIPGDFKKLGSYDNQSSANTSKSIQSINNSENSRNEIQESGLERTKTE